jgi:hypothetical protein
VKYSKKSDSEDEADAVAEKMSQLTWEQIGELCKEAH